jgi:hypothetical protein
MPDARRKKRALRLSQVNQLLWSAQHEAEPVAANVDECSEERVF